MSRRRRQQERQKAIDWIGKQQLCICRTFCAALHNFDLKMPNFTFYGAGELTTTKISFSFWTWLWFLEIQLQKSSLAFEKVTELE